jgi:hypothetical protein
MRLSNQCAHRQAEMVSRLLDDCSAWIRDQDSGNLKIDGLQ